MLHVCSANSASFPPAQAEVGRQLNDQIKVNPTQVSNRVNNPVNAVQGVPSELRLILVDLNFECSTDCLPLLGLMGIWQKRPDSWARLWNTEIKVNPI